MNLSKQVKLQRVENAAAAGTTDLTSDWVDTQGFEGVMFVAAFGTITAGAVTTIKAQQAAASDGTGAADLEGTSITVADDDDNQIAAIDIFRPQERYVALVVDRGTQNAVVDGVIAILYGPRELPTTHDTATVVSVETHVSPAEGTA